jgi:hypothetical protein
MTSKASPFPLLIYALNRKDHLKGSGAASFNYVQGDLKGLTIGIFNYAHQVKGIQLGVLNYVRDNPKGLKFLPLFNTGFRK